MEHDIPTVKDQIEQITKLIKENSLQVGDNQAYIISSSWFSKWKNSGDINEDQTKIDIGPINNTEIVGKDNELNLAKKENEDYIILPPPAWFKLIEWYGGGPQISIPVRLNSSNQSVAITFKYYIYCTYKSEENVPFTVFDLMKLSELEKDVRKKFHIKDSTEIRFLGNDKSKPLNQNDSLIGNNIQSYSKLFVDYRKEGASKWHSEKSEEELNDESSDDELTNDNVYYSDDTHKAPGVCGLQNIGNTCYFNSALQCLLHCIPFIRYFLVDNQPNSWYKLFASNNQNGSKGQLVIAFMELAKDIWSGKYTSIKPVRLKNTIDEFTEQFRGTQQQDAHELLTFLLDGLHEELKAMSPIPTQSLNSINVSSSGLSKEDIQASNETWLKHKSKSSSIIVDMFQGLLRSQILCPICNEMTTVFDPYMILSLPLAKRGIEISTFIFVPLDYKKPYKKFELSYTSQEEAEKLLRSSLATNLIFAYREKTGSETSFNWGFPKKKSNVEIIALEAPPFVNQENPSQQHQQQMNQPMQHMNAYFPYYPNPPQYYPYYQQTVPPFYPQMQFNPNYQMMQPIQPPMPSMQPKIEPKGPCYIACYLNIKIRNMTLVDDAAKLITKNASAPFLVQVENFEISREDLNAKLEQYFEFCFNNANQKPNEETETSHEAVTAFLEDAVLNNEECDLDFNQYRHEYDQKPGRIMVDFPSEYYIINDKKRYFKPSPLYNRLSHLFYPVYVNANLVTSENKDFNRDLLFKHVASLDKNNYHENIERITLENCFELFSDKEILDSRNQWFCKTCHRMVNATKKLEIWTAPEILIIHLKRFISEDDTFQKIDSHVFYPDELNMAPHLAGPAKNKKCMYRLFAVCDHFGNIHNGHYTATARVCPNWIMADSHTNYQEIKGKFYHFNDSSVNQCKTKDAHGHNAYILFYEKIPCNE